MEDLEYLVEYLEYLDYLGYMLVYAPNVGWVEMEKIRKPIE